MPILLGNLRSFETLGEKEKMNELENKLRQLGYENEDNCEKNKDINRKTWHIYDMPRVINFSVLPPEIIELLKEYSPFFNGRIAVSATSQTNL